jgi:hypothetical protein
MLGCCVLVKGDDCATVLTDLNAPWGKVLCKEGVPWMSLPYVGDEIAFGFGAERAFDG